jgi:hypothetical protein
VLGPSAFWNPKGLSRPVQGVVFAFFYKMYFDQEKRYIHDYETINKNMKLENKI